MLGKMDFKMDEELLNMRSNKNFDDKYLLKKYLINIYNDLTLRNGKKDPFLTKFSFFDYTRLPVFISENLYRIFDRANTQKLSLEDFIHGMTSFLTANAKEIFELFFKFCDFDSDDEIQIDDIKLIIHYLEIAKKSEAAELFPKAMSNSRKGFNKEEFQILMSHNKLILKCLKVIYEGIPVTSDSVNVLKQDKKIFTDLNKSSDSFENEKFERKVTLTPLQDLDKSCLDSGIVYREEQEYIIEEEEEKNQNEKFIFEEEHEDMNENEEFIFKHQKEQEQESNRNSVDEFEARIKEERLRLERMMTEGENLSDEDNEGHMTIRVPNTIQKRKMRELIYGPDLILTQSVRHVVETPIEPSNRKTKLDSIRERAKIDSFRDKQFFKKQTTFNREMEQSKLSSQADTKFDTKFTSNGGETKVDSKPEKSVFSKESFSPPKRFLRNQTLQTPLANPKRFSRLNSFNRLGTMSSVKNLSPINAPQTIKFNTTYEGYVYKLTSNNKLRKFWIAIINMDMFYFNSSKDKFKGLHHLTRCYAEMGIKAKIGNKIYYSFDYIFCTRRRNYFCETMDECVKWVQMLHQVTNYRDIYDHFEIFKLLGKGHFGEVRQGVDRKTKEYVAVKIMDKEKLKQDEVECIRMEAEVLKHCNHRNVLRLVDSFESYSTIYIVLEYLTGGNLTNFLTRQNTIINDAKAKTIIYQIGRGLKYLNDLGIMHRDLKPDNIMLSSKDESCVIKIVDFGLARIVGTKVKVYDTFGTLAYVAPEVISKVGYNKEADIWSLGVIIYYVLSGKLPFEECRLDFKKIIHTIMYKKMDFPKHLFGHASNSALDMIEKCLTEQSRRITIDKFLEHPWFHY
jgi:hypothetical protein